MNIQALNFNEDIQSLLSDADLPYEDLLQANSVKLFGIREEEKIVATIGLEAYGDIGMLRSFVVSPSIRGQGYGEYLLAFIESWAKDNKISSLYLLTTTAENYFNQYGYKLCARELAPTAICHTPQFSSLCPSSAAFMCKHLI